MGKTAKRVPTTFMHGTPVAIARNGKIRSLDEVIGEANRMRRDMVTGEATDKYLRHLDQDGVEEKPAVVKWGKTIEEIEAIYKQHVTLAATHYGGQTYGMVDEGQQRLPVPMPGYEVKGVHKLDMTLDLANPTKITKVAVEGPYTRLRKQAANVTTALSCVVGYPAPPDENNSDYVHWEQDQIDWALAEWGEFRAPGTKGPDDEGEAGVVQIAFHWDEQLGHGHVLVMDPQGHSVKYLDPGEVSITRSRARGDDDTLLGAAYRVGWSRAQDRYWEAVGKKRGWERGEPGGERQTMEEVRRRQRLDARFKELEDTWDARLDGIDKREADLAARETRLQGWAAQLSTDTTRFSAMQQAFHDRKKREADQLKEERAILDTARIDYANMRAAEAEELAKLHEELRNVREQNRALASAITEAVDRIGVAVEEGALEPDEAKRLREILNGEANVLSDRKGLAALSR
jgi:hypothetical protein